MAQIDDPNQHVPLKEGSYKDRGLIPRGDVLLEDLHPSLYDMLFIDGKITLEHLDETLRRRLRLSGEITFEDLEETAKTVFARNGYIDYEHLSAELRDRLIHSNIKEAQLSPELADKINSTTDRTIELIDCGGFLENVHPDEYVFDGGEW